MEIDISGRHFQVTDALKKYITEKVKKLSKYSDKLEAIHVVLDVQKIHQVCEITTRGRGLKLTAKEDAADMYASFDNAFGSLERQLRKTHDRLKDRKSKRLTKLKDANSL